MGEPKRDEAMEWNKTYVVYNKKHDLLGIHKGPKFMEFDDGGLYYWPHQIDHGGMVSFLNEKTFVKNYYYIGEL